MPFETAEQQGLRCRALECITVIGVAVGKEKFGQDALLMDAIQKTQQVLKDDDTQVSYIQQAYSRICRVLGKDFIPYMQYVMPALLASARAEEVELDEEVGSMVAADDDEDDGSINIRTSVLEEKCTACGMICCYLE